MDGKLAKSESLLLLCFHYQRVHLVKSVKDVLLYSSCVDIPVLGYKNVFYLMLNGEPVIGNQNCEIGNR